MVQALHLVQHLVNIHLRPNQGSHQNIGNIELIATVKKWFRDKNFGYIENGGGPDILVRKADLLNCSFLKVGVNVEFECHPEKQGLIAKKVKLKPLDTKTGHQNKPFKFGVMT